VSRNHILGLLESLSYRILGLLESVEQPPIRATPPNRANPQIEQPLQSDSHILGPLEGVEQPPHRAAAFWVCSRVSSTPARP